ncbi:MAG TPA: hypothetical protein VGM77_04745 [Gemmatimonadales bacterium]
MSMLAGIAIGGRLGAQSASACTFDTAAHTHPVAVTIAARVMRGDNVDAELTDTIGAILRAGPLFPATVNTLLYPFTHFSPRDTTKTEQAQVFGELEFVAATKKTPPQIRWSDLTADGATNALIDSLLHAADQVGRLQMLWDAVKSDKLPVRLELTNGTNHPATVLARFSIPMVTLESTADLRALVLPESGGLGQSAGPVNLSFVVSESGQAIRSSVHASSALPPKYIAAVVASAMKSQYLPARAGGCAVKGDYVYTLFVGKRTTADTVLESTVTRTRIPPALRSR